MKNEDKKPNTVEADKQDQSGNNQTTLSWFQSRCASITEEVPKALIVFAFRDGDGVTAGNATSVGYYSKAEVANLCGDTIAMAVLALRGWARGQGCSEQEAKELEEQAAFIAAARVDRPSTEHDADRAD